MLRILLCGWKIVLQLKETLMLPYIPIPRRAQISLASIPRRHTLSKESTMTSHTPYAYQQFTHHDFTVSQTFSSNQQITAGSQIFFVKIAVEKDVRMRQIGSFRLSSSM